MADTHVGAEVAGSTRETFKTVIFNTCSTNWTIKSNFSVLAAVLTWGLMIRQVEKIFHLYLRLIFTLFLLIGNHRWQGGCKPQNPVSSSFTGLSEANLGNKAAPLLVGNLDPPPCPPTWPMWWLSRRDGCIKEVHVQKDGASWFLFKYLTISLHLRQEWC